MADTTITNDYSVRYQELYQEEQRQRSVNNDLGKDAFLQLLVAQMTYQDPLEPNKDTQFIAQLAQFSALEQMQQMNAATLVTQANSMIGKYVFGEIIGADGQPYLIEGTVDGVSIKNGVAYLMVGSHDLPLSGVQYALDPAYAQKLIEEAGKAAGSGDEETDPVVPADPDPGDGDGSDPDVDAVG